MLQKSYLNDIDGEIFYDGQQMMEKGSSGANFTFLLNCQSSKGDEKKIEAPGLNIYCLVSSLICFLTPREIE